VDVGPVRLVVGGDPDGLFEPERNQAGEEEAPERIDVEGDHGFGDGGVDGVAGGVGGVDETV